MLLTQENINLVALSFVNQLEEAVTKGDYPRIIIVNEGHKVTAIRTIHGNNTFYNIEVEGEQICTIDIAKLRGCAERAMGVHTVKEEFSKGCYPFVQNAIHAAVGRMMDVIQGPEFEGVALGFGLAAQIYCDAVPTGKIQFIDVLANVGTRLIYSAPHRSENHSDLFSTLAHYLSTNPLDKGLTVNIP